MSEAAGLSEERERMSMATGLYQTDSQDPVEQWIAQLGRSLLNVSATSMPIVNDSTILRMAVRELLAVRNDYRRHLAEDCNPKAMLLISEDDQLRAALDDARRVLENIGTTAIPSDQDERHLWAIWVRQTAADAFAQTGVDRA